MGGCDAFILPSHIEGMSNALLEAMAMGLPCIASNVGGIPNVIEDNINGILMEPKNIKQMAEKILLIKNDPVLRIKISNNAVKSVHKNHNLKNAITVLSELL